MERNFLKERLEQNIGKKIEASFESGALGTIPKKFPGVERRKNLTLDEFENEFRKKGKPVVAEGLLSDWKAVGKWNFPYLKEKCGSVSVEVDTWSVATSKKMPLGEFIDSAKAVSVGKSPIYLQGWNFKNYCPFLSEDLGDIFMTHYDFRPKLYGEMLEYGYRVLWIGQKDAVTQIHYDALWLDVVHGQLSGSKTWWIFSPDAVIGADKNGEPDFDGFVKNSKAVITHCTLHPGDVIFLPARWWHRVKILEDSVGLGMQTLNEVHLAKHMQGLLQELVPLACNHDYIKKTYPDVFHRTVIRRLEHAKLMNIDLNQIIVV